MTFTVEKLEFFLVILVRMAGFIALAPFFNVRSVPVRVRLIIAIALSMIVFNITPFSELVYQGVIGYAVLIIKETLVGMMMGFFTNIVFLVLGFVGHMIDMQIGFSQLNEYDPLTREQVTVTSNIYSYSIMLLMIVSNLHLYFIKTIVESYSMIPVGGAKVPVNIFLLLVDFIKDFFIIGFRIELPIFAVMLLMNVVLAILAKIAPQMNMFVVGHQMKILAGLVVLTLMMNMLPGVADYIFNEMAEMLNKVMSYF